MKPVFTNCNVCGRQLARKDELAAGMCAICSNEEIPTKTKRNSPRKVAQQIASRVETPAPASHWITDELPDSDMTVLMRVKCEENPVWPGFHDGENWIYADASRVTDRTVLGWMELETAAKLLDGKTK